MTNPVIPLGFRIEDEAKIPPYHKETRQEQASRERKNRRRAKRGDRVDLKLSHINRGHAVIRGATNEGKSQRMMVRFIKFCMRPYVVRWKGLDGKVREAEERPYGVVVDYGSDRALANEAKAIADELGIRMRILSNDASKSEPYDLFQGLKYGMNRNLASSTFVTGSGFGGEHGQHGSQYFAGQGLLQTNLFMDWSIRRSEQGLGTSMADVDRMLRDPDNQIKDANQIRAVCNALSYYPQLSTSGGINHLEGAKNGELHYLYLGTRGEEQPCRAIGAMAQENAVSAMKILSESVSEEEIGKPKKKLYLFIDEAQEVANTLPGLLGQSRKFGVSVVLAHQTSSQWDAVDRSIKDIVRDNSNTKIYFTCSTESDIRELGLYSKMGIDFRRSFNGGGGFIASGGRNSASESKSEYETPLCDHNRILDASANTGEFFLVANQDGEHQEPIRARADFLFSEEEYLRFSTTPLPNIGARNKLVSRQSGGLIADVSDWKIRHRMKANAKRQDHLKRVGLMLQKIRQEHSLG